MELDRTWGLFLPVQVRIQVSPGRMLSQCPTLAHINPALYVKSLSLGYFAVYSFSYCALYELYSVVAFTSKEV